LNSLVALQLASEAADLARWITNSTELFKKPNFWIKK
jgi:hypothetical protein